jgi:anti-sigma B factor antagonist
VIDSRSVTRTSDAYEGSASDELLRWSIGDTAPESLVTLAGEIDLSTSDALGRFLESVVERQAVKVVVDLERVSFLDSSGIKSLLSAAHAAAAAGCAFVALNPSPIVERVLVICGVDELLLGGSVGDGSDRR